MDELDRGVVFLDYYVSGMGGACSSYMCARVGMSAEWAGGDLLVAISLCKFTIV